MTTGTSNNTATAGKPTGKPAIVFYSSPSNNTTRFVEKLAEPAIRIPVDLAEPIEVNEDYILIIPTYSGGGTEEGAVPRQVIHFLNNPKNREHCIGVISGGNSNFGASYGLAGTVVGKKLHIPFWYRFELLGTPVDVENVEKIIADPAHADQLSNIPDNLIP